MLEAGLVIVTCLFERVQNLNLCIFCPARQNQRGGPLRPSQQQGAGSDHTTQFADRVRGGETSEEPAIRKRTHGAARGVRRGGG